MSKILIILLCCITCCFSANTVFADVITFNDVQLLQKIDGSLDVFDNPIFEPEHIYPSVYGGYAPGFSDGVLNYAGFSFSGDHFHIVNKPESWIYGGFPVNNSYYIGTEAGGQRSGSITMTSLDGRPFSLIGFEGAESCADFLAAAEDPTWHYQVAARIAVTGRTADGRDLSASFTLDRVNDSIGANTDFQSFFLPSGWENLTSVTFSGLTADSLPGGFSIDDVIVTRGPSHVAIVNKSLVVNGSGFTIKGVVYSPVPIGDNPQTNEPYGDYFTSAYSPVYSRDLPLLRQMGANTVRLLSWTDSTDHSDFLSAAYNNGIDPIFVIVGYGIDPGLDIDPNSPSHVRQQIIEDFRAMVAAHKNYPAVLMWSIGSNLNDPSVYGNSLENLFSLMNEMAEAAHSEEGTMRHPVTTALSDSDLVSTISTYETSVPSLDIWGANIYRGNTFGTLFSDLRSVSSKPLIMLEYGIDAYNAIQGDEYENLGAALQAEYAASLWSDMMVNADICIGGTIMEYSDEWWKGDSWTGAGCSDDGPDYHGLCGFSSPAHPDGYSNMEWWGIMRASRDGANPNVMTPRALYNTLQSMWLPPIFAYLSIDSDAPFATMATVSLGLSCNTGVVCTHMQFSNDSITWSMPELFSSVKTWNLSPGDALKTVYGRVQDSNGTWSHTVTDTIALDMMKPVTAASPAGGTYGGTLAITLSCDDGSGSGCDKTYYTTDGSVPTTASPVYSGPLALSATTTLRYFSADRAGNTEAVKTQTYTIIYDTAEPVTTATPAGGTYDGARTVTLSCSDGAGSGCDKTYYTTDGSVPTTASSVYSIPLTMSVTTTLRYFSVDRAGNAEAVKTQTYVINTNPSITINGGTTYTISRSVTLSLFCGSAGCTQMQLSNDNITWPAAETYRTTRNWTLTSGEGEKTVYVKYRDSAGNWSGVYSDSIIFDLTKPVTTATPAGGTYGGTQTITLSCSDGAGSGCDKTYYTTDGSVPTTASPVYSGPLALSVTTTLQYFSVDRAGNTEAVKTQTYIIVPDTTAPVTTATPAGGTYGGTQTITLSCSDGAGSGCDKTYYTTDGSVPTTASPVYSGPLALSVTTTLQYFSVDRAGNTEAVKTQTYIIVPDTTAPVTTATPAGGTYGGTQTITLSCSDGAGSGCDKTYYTTDGSVPTTASPVYSGPLALSATTTLRYFSADRAGNTEAVKTQTYVINTNPSMTINAGATYTISRSVTLSLFCGSTGCTQMQLSNDNITWLAAETYRTTRNWTLTSGEGEKTVYVKYRDSAGNWSGVYSDSIIFDLTKPVTTATPAGGIYGGTQTITLSCSDGAGSGCDKTYYTTDGSVPTTASSVYSGTLSLSATTTLQYFSVDRAGNTEAVKTQIYIIVPDTTAPVTTANPPGGTYGGTQTITLSCSDGAGSGCDRTYYTTDGSVPTTASPVYSGPLALSATTTLQYFSVDRAGNTEAVKTQTYTIVPDTTAPVTTATPAGGTYGGTQTITLSCSDGAGSGCDKTYYTTDGSVPTTASSVYSGPLSLSATTTLQYFSVDRAGNTEAVKTQTYVINTNPSITINAGAVYTNSRTVALSLFCGSTGCTQMQLSNDNVTWNPPDTYRTTASWSLTSADGEKTVYVKYRDSAGNWSSAYVDTIILDRTRPTNGLLSAVTGTGYISLTWSGFSDALSGISRYSLVYSDTSAPTSCATGTLIYSGSDTFFTHTVPAQGVTYYYRVCAVDSAGNVSTGATDCCFLLTPAIKYLCYCLCRERSASAIFLKNGRIPDKLK